MKKNGFTLVELLAVITILGLLALLSSSAISSIIRGSRNSKESINIDTILNAAYDYVQRNPSSLPEKDQPSTFCATKLINEGLLKCEIVEDRQMDEKFSIENHVITITYEDEAETAGEEEDVKTTKYFGRYKFSYDEKGSIDCSADVLRCNVVNEKE